MHYFYIIYSNNANKFYTGETTNLSLRLIKHNSHLYNGAYTKIASDWKYVLTFETETKDEVLYLEYFTKKMKSRKFIEKIIIDNQILKDILDKR